MTVLTFLKNYHSVNSNFFQKRPTQSKWIIIFFQLDFFSLIFYVILPMKTRLSRSVDLHRTRGGEKINKKSILKSLKTIRFIFDCVRYLFWFLFQKQKIICSAQYRLKSIKFQKWFSIGGKFDILKWSVMTKFEQGVVVGLKSQNFTPFSPIDKQLKVI